MKNCYYCCPSYCLSGQALANRMKTRLNPTVLITMPTAPYIPPDIKGLTDAEFDPDADSSTNDMGYG